MSASSFFFPLINSDFRCPDGSNYLHADETVVDSHKKGDTNHTPIPTEQAKKAFHRLISLMEKNSTAGTQPVLQRDTTVPRNFRIDLTKVKKKEIKAPKPRYTRWSEYEDKKLLQLVNSIGEKWAAISRCFKDKNEASCRYRYLHQIDPSLKHGPFSPDETAQLINYVKEYPKQWATIGKLMNRSPMPLKHIYTKMCSK
jgi:hypothetical protein